MVCLLLERERERARNSKTRPSPTLRRVVCGAATQLGRALSLAILNVCSKDLRNEQRRGQDHNSPSSEFHIHNCA